MTAGAAMLLLLAGCAVPVAGGGGSPSEIRPPIEITHPHAQLSCPDIPITHLPLADEGFDAGYVVSVFHCTADYHEVQGVMNKVQYITELKEDPSALLEAYAVADLPPTDGPCTTEYRDPFIIWVELPDREFVAAYAPLDECGKPQEAASAAFEGADFREILVAREVGEPE